MKIPAHPAIPWLFLLFLTGPVAAQTLQSVGLLPPTVTGGGNSSGQVSLTGPAPSGGITVSLLSGSPAVATVPASVLVPQGSTSKVFTITTAAVSSTVQVTIDARLGSLERSAVLTVEPDYPPFFDNPPAKLLIGAFTLNVTNYETKTWDFSQSLMTNATGTATVTLVPDGVTHLPQVRFENLTVQPVVQGTGKVIGGTAVYPDPTAAPPGPEPLVLTGFVLFMDDLSLSPTSATATGKLRTPRSIADGTGQCLSGQLDLGSFAITPQCEFYLSRPAQGYGPWIITNTGMKVSGTGFEADFSSAQSPAVNPPLLPSWRGVLLAAGATVPSPHPVSNTGYLQAKYGFAPAYLTNNGFSAKLDLAADFIFDSLEPEGYEIELEEGHLDLVNNSVQGGQFTHNAPWADNIRLPVKAVAKPYGGRQMVSFTLLTVQPDLDLFAEVTPDYPYYDFGQATPSAVAYEVKTLQPGFFYLSATHRNPYRPLDPGGNFQNPILSNPAGDLESQGLQGVTLPLRGNDQRAFILVINTTDTPGDAPIGGTLFDPASWINFGGRGVHGQIQFSEVLWTTNNQVDLGPEEDPAYAGQVPLKTTWSSPGDRYPFLIQFVDSAVHRSEVTGTVRLEGAVKADLPFHHLQFTSTAHCPGAKVDVVNGVKLDYWKLDLVKKPGSTAIGPMSVKTGQIFLTAAGIQEPRHFEKPFWLTWGEILASGQFGRIVFDHNSSGQKFDGFDFEPEVVALSDYDDTDSTHEKAYLQAAGMIHFDFFGENYLDLRDFFSPIAGDPMNGRKIELGFDGAHGAKPTDDQLHRDWSGGFGAAKFKIGYDDGDQDGFVSIGTETQVNNIKVIYLAGELFTSLNLSRDRTCMSIGEMELRDAMVPPLADFARMKRITGCACIEDGQLKRMNLAAEVDNSLAALVLRAGTYLGMEMALTPSTTELRLHGDMFISVTSGGGDIQIDGQARFLINRDELFTEGDLIGKISAASAIGVVNNGALTAEGQLSWHLGTLLGGNYHSIQGRVAVGVISPLQLASVGVEGGFYIGVNAPSDKAWVLLGTDPRYQFDLQLPDRLTGFYGYAKVSAVVNAYVISGGFETYAGLGVFVSDKPEDLGLPAVVGHLRTYIWGEFLGGLVSAAAWGDLQLFLSPSDPQFKGTLGVEVCALWVLCAQAEISMLVDTDGVHFD